MLSHFKDTRTLNSRGSLALLLVWRIIFSQSVAGDDFRSSFVLVEYGKSRGCISSLIKLWIECCGHHVVVENPFGSDNVAKRRMVICGLAVAMWFNFFVARTWPLGPLLSHVIIVLIKDGTHSQQEVSDVIRLVNKGTLIFFLLSANEPSFQDITFGLNPTKTRRSRQNTLIFQTAQTVCDSKDGKHFSLSPHGLSSKKTIVAARKLEASIGTQRECGHTHKNLFLFVQAWRPFLWGVGGGGQFMILLHFRSCFLEAWRAWKKR